MAYFVLSKSAISGSAYVFFHVTYLCYSHIGITFVPSNKIAFLGITDTNGNASFEITSPISLYYSQSLTGGVFIVSPCSILYSTFDGSNPENLYLYQGSRFQQFPPYFRC